MLNRFSTFSLWHWTREKRDLIFLFSFIIWARRRVHRRRLLRRSQQQQRHRHHQQHRPQLVLVREIETQKTRFMSIIFTLTNVILVRFCPFSKSTLFMLLKCVCGIRADFVNIQFQVCRPFEGLNFLHYWIAFLEWNGFEQSRWDKYS